MQAKPWYRVEPGSPDVGPAIKRSVEACAKLRESALFAAANNTLLYHRESLLQLARLGNGYQHAMPDRLQDHLGVAHTAGAQPVTLNITKSAVDAVVSSLMVENPAIRIRPDGTTFAEAEAWRERELALNSTMNARDQQTRLRDVGRDGLVSNEGHVYPCLRDGTIHYRRLRPEQVLWDPHDARADDGRSFVHMVLLVDRGELVAYVQRLRRPSADGGDPKPLPDRAKILEAITRAPRESDELPGMRAVYDPLRDWLLEADGLSDDTDRVRVVYSWRRSSRMGESDGRQAITLLGGNPVVILDAPFARTTLPVVSWTPYPGQGGVGDLGVVGLLAGWQHWLDRTLAKVVSYQDEFGWLKLLVHKNEFDAVEIEALKLCGVRVIAVSNPGKEAQWMRPEVLSREDIEILRMILELSRSEYGINRLLTQGTSQLRGQVSGAAIVEEDAKTRDRLSDVREQWADFRVAVARATLDAMDDARAMDPEFAAQYVTEDGVRVSRTWAELTKINGRYQLDLEEVGILSNSRSARVAKTIEFWQGGLLPVQAAQQALWSTPDMRALMSLTTAPQRLAMRHMRDLKRSPDDPPVPNKDLDLPTALEVVTAEIQNALATAQKPPTEAESAVIQALRMYRLQVEGLMQPRPQPAPPAIDMPMLQPEEGPEMPGVDFSDTV